MQAGEEKKFDLTFPEDYPNTSLRGQVAHVEVQCKEVKSRTLPEWNDELARQAGAESLETLRTQARTDLEAAAQRHAAEDYENQVAEKLVEQATIKFPPNLLELELDELLEDFDKRLQREQRLHLDDYLKVENKTKEQLRDEFRPAAEKRLRNGLVLSEVADQEKLTVAAREVQAQLDGLAQRFGMDAKAARQLATSEDLRRSLSNTLLTRRVLEWLAQSAKGELETPPAPAAEVEAAIPTPSE
jgi:trigger factor